MRLRSALLIAAVPSILSGCATFATVRSADSYVGPSTSMQFSWSAPPGDVASWFWSLDCVQECNHPLVGAALGYTYGWRPRHGPRAVALGMGVSGVNPYVDGYVQLAGAPRAFGVGARTALPVWGWSEHQIYARYDIPVTKGSRVLLNPGVFILEGGSPNGANIGSFISYVQGVGLQIDGEYASWTPAVAVVRGRAQHSGYGQQDGPASSVFATASLGMTFHRRRVKPDH